MNNIELKKYLIDRKILGPSGHRSFKTEEKLLLDKEAFVIWENFKNNYRSEAEAWCCISNEITPPHCPICGNLCKFNGSKRHNFYNTTCGNCSANAVNTKLNKFNETIAGRSEEERHSISEKRKLTNLQKYGDANYNLFGSESFKTNLKEKYNNEYYNNQEKRKQTCLERYGVTTNLMLVERHAPDYEKVKQTNLSRYGVEHAGQIKSAQEKAKASKKASIQKICIDNNLISIQELIYKYGQGWYCAKLVPIIRIGQYSFVTKDDELKIIKYWEEGKTHTNGYVSKKEKELLDYIKSIYNGKIVENDTSTVPNNNHRFFELDIFLPDEMIAFDFDGIYYHSTKFKDKEYHQRKTLCSYKAGVKLAHILESEWDNNKDNVKEKIKNLIFNHRNFNDGFFPTFELDVKLTEPRKHVVGSLEYYDTGIIY